MLSNIKGTNTFTKKRKDLKTLKDAILLCLGGNSLYASITNVEGIPAVKIAFRKYESRTKGVEQT